MKKFPWTFSVAAAFVAVGAAAHVHLVGGSDPLRIQVAAATPRAITASILASGVLA